jgi:MYXO-CTERM domain-containing protein
MPKAAVHVRLGITLSLFALVASGVGCTAESAPPEGMGDPPAGAVRGALDFNVATYDDGRTETEYFLHPGDGSELRLLFDAEPDLAGGTKVDIWGTPENGRLRVNHFEVLPEARISQALINGMAYKPRSFGFAIVQIGMPPMPLNQMDADRKLFGVTPNNVPSVRQYYMEVSYGRQDIAGKVLGPFQYQMTGCGTSALAQALRPMIPETYDHYLWYIEPRTQACGWSGLASSGRPDRPSKDTWYNGSSGCVVLVQEPGHNFGMQHSSSMKCPNNQPFVDLPDKVCVHSEYGDRYDPMGGGCRHMNAFQKAYQGWFDKCNLVDTPVSGTYTLLPLELPCDGVQAITVPFPHVRPFTRSGGGGGATTDQLSNYLVEFRTPTGIDTGLAPVVQIRATSSLRDRTQRGLHTWFLDMNPATPTLDGLTAGQSYTDPSGSPKITVTAMDATKATIQVEFATPPPMGMGPTCLDDTPFTGPGPGPESCAARVASPAGAPPAIPDGGATPPPATPRDGGGGRRDAGTPDTSPIAIADASTPNGAGGEGGGGTPGGATGGTGGSAPPTGPVTVSSGCGCRVGATPDQTPTAGLFGCAFLVGALLLRRRRR